MRPLLAVVGLFVAPDENRLAADPGEWVYLASEPATT